MAKIMRAGQQRFSSSIWPGFVDAMTALLLVLMFVLTIFMIVQFILRETISTQDTQLNYLSAQVASLAEALGLEQQKSDGLEVEVDRLGGELIDANSTAEIQAALISTLTRQAEAQKTQLDEFAAKVTSFEAQVASLLAERNRLSAANASLQGQVTDTNARNSALAARISEVEAANLREVTAREALQLALAQARTEIDEATETARLAAAKREALEALVAQTQAELGDRETSLQAALQALDAARGDLGETATTLGELEARLVTMAADLEASQTAHGQEVARNQQLQERLGLLEQGLSRAEKERLAADAAAAALKAELEAKNSILTTEEKARLAEAAAAAALRKRLADAETALSEEEKSKLAEMAAAEALRKKLEQSQTELTAMTLALEQQRKDAEDTLTLLAAAESARNNLDDLLATTLATLEQTKAERDAARAEVTVATTDKAVLKDRLAAVLAQLDARGDDASKRLAEADQTREDLERRLAAALAAKLAAEQAGEKAMSEAEQRQALLRQANEVLAAEKALSAETQREVALLNQQTAALRKQLNALQSLLDEAESRDIAAKVQIKNLGANLNTALAQVAQEQRNRARLEEAERKRLEAETRDLEKFKSEFFGQLRELLGNREGVRIVGDRFVFSSEVLFEPGSVDLSGEGRNEITKVAGVIRDIADQIPPGIDWILRVDGHTDDVPLASGGKYADNWELSQGRALSVVRYMIEDLGLPADRLAAAGFGEYQPVNREDSSEARAQNRRIELKFTEK